MGQEIVTEAPEENLSSKYLIRQIFVNSGVWMSFFMAGLAVGTPTVAIAQLRREAQEKNNTEALSVEMDSWISSIWAFAAVPWIFIIAYIANSYGRKPCQFLTAASTAAGFMIVYIGTGKLALLISELVFSVLIAALSSSTLMVGTETSSAKYRGIFLALKTVSSYWGLWVANAVGTFFHYKVIAIIGLYCSIHLFVTSFWSESPFWLASKGKYKESIEQHRWLKGDDKKTEEELQKLIYSTKEFIKQSRAQNSKNVLVNLWSTMKLKEFYAPTLLGLLVMVTYQTSGKVVCSVYAIQIIKKISKNESTAYIGMLILDGVVVGTMVIGSVMSRYLKRRTLLLWSSWPGEIFIFTLALYTFLISRSVINENPYVTIFLLAMFSISLSMGLIILSTSLLGELMPIRYKSLAACIAGIGGMITTALFLKTAPSMFKHFGTHGSFLCYGLLSTFFLLLVQKYLPEIKGKTLQEIEEYFKEDKENKSACELKELNHSNRNSANIELSRDQATKYTFIKVN